MTWLVWRQHRVQYCVGAALLAAFAVLIVITGAQVAHQYQAAQAACAAGQGCRHLGGLFLGSHVVGFLVISTLGAPALVGLFWGAPLVAAEAEAGTTQFAWMQSVTRRRWLTVKIGWMLLAAAVWGGVISALVTWWSGPDNAQQLDAFNPGRFDIMGLVPVAYSVFAVALGIAAGAVTRRILPAMALTLAGFIAVRMAVAFWLRPHYMSAVTVFYKATSGFTPAGLLLAALLGHHRPGRPADQYELLEHGRHRRHPGQLPAGLLQPHRPRFLYPAAVVHAGAEPLPRVPHLPARRPLLGVPGHRDRHLPRPGRGPRRGDRGGAAPPGRLIGPGCGVKRCGVKSCFIRCIESFAFMAVGWAA